MATLLAGCSASFAPGPVTPEQVAIGTIQGNVHGGNFPVTGAQIYLFAAGQGGYGTSATSLMTSGASGVSCSNAVVSGACYASTDANGDFSVGGDYTCTEGQQVYMVAVGGNPGLSGSVNNTATVQMAALGQCPASGSMASQVPYLVINEATTVAFAYSVGGFATNAYNVSSDASGETAIANAFANANNIVTLGDGQVPAVTNGNTNSVNPQSKMNALANILATCVNTTTSSSSQCTNLFKYAKTSSGTAATDEATAIFNIVHNQTQNVANIYNLGGSTGPFSPTLSAAPTDWTMPVVYNNAVSTLSTNGSTYTSGAFGMAFDAEGNAWIGDRAQGVVKIGPQGALTTFTNSAHGFSMVKGVAVSPEDGSIWATDYGNDDIYVMDSSGNHLKTITQDVAGHGPDATAFALNPEGSGYIAYEAEESSTGIVAYDAGTYAVDKYETTPYDNLSSPGWITVDNKGAVWIPSLGSAEVGGLTTSYKNDILAYATSTAGLAESYVTIADGLGNIWVPSDVANSTLYQVTAGQDMGSSTGGGMNLPWRAAVDGNNVVWLANLDANTISGFSVPLYTAGASTAWLSSSGYSTSAAGGTGVAAIGVDLSGDVWTANADGSATQLLGLGTPTAAPIYGGSTVTTGTGRTAKSTVTNGNLGTEP